MMILLIPCLINGTLKLMRRPSLRLVSLRYDSSWASNTGRHLFNRFELDDHGIIGQQIEAKPGLQPQAVVDDGKTKLSSKRDSPLLQFMAQARLVYGFHETRTQ